MELLPFIFDMLQYLEMIFLQWEAFDPLYKIYGVYFVGGGAAGGL